MVVTFLDAVVQDGSFKSWFIADICRGFYVIHHGLDEETKTTRFFFEWCTFGDRGVTE
jgi:hypothetical protein